MGAFKQMEIEAIENSIPPNYNEEDEFHFHHTISDFCELASQYGIDAIVGLLPAELRFVLLESIIKSQGKLMKGN